MAEYIEREAARNIFTPPLREPDSLDFWEWLQSEIDAIPAADVRPVVPCCDCKHFQVNVSPSGYLPQGVPECECRHWLRPTDPTDFCSWGKKREES